MTLILNGKIHADNIISKVKDNIEQRIKDNLKQPCLAVIIVGEDPASQIYVRNKIITCKNVGIQSIEYKLPINTSQEELESTITQLNLDKTIDGILLQLPLPKTLNYKQAIYKINPNKDVDGLHPLNQGFLMTNQPALQPCTPSACINILHAYNLQISGKRAIIIGRSESVGKPLSLMLLRENATVTIAHSMTNNLQEICKQADIIVAAVGQPGLVRGSWIKSQATVIDVGINRIDNLTLGKKIFQNNAQKIDELIKKHYTLCGDVRFDEALEISGAITPVPGGIGPLTIANLMLNTLKATQINEK